MTAPANRDAGRYPYKVSWAAFILLLLFATVFVILTAPELPPLVASHFDTAGEPNAYMTHSGYIRFVLGLGVGLPVVLVALLASVYSRATDMKLPNRDYWLAPQRIGQTRAFLTAHGVWFGSLLVTMVCFVHWLELGANRQQPPHLSSGTLIAGVIAFFLATLAWIGAIMFAFRRPPGE